jgi:predicted nucleic acid-binding protein
MNVFIDTNILLSFFHYASDDLEELKKLIVLLAQKKIVLFLPTQVTDEFRRNRENKIADALKRLKDQKLNLQYPQFCKDYPEYEEMRKLLKPYETHHATMLSKLSDDIQNHNLKADGITRELFKLATRVTCGEKEIDLARDRQDIGNPPGKAESLGDAINWVALLEAVPNKEDLHFVSDDRDYVSPLDDEKFNGFLTQEWAERKLSNLVFYRRLSAFFKEHFPDIKLAAELEKDLLIEALAKSPTFARTHLVVAQLSKFTDFQPEQLNAIVSAATSNSQVYSIIDDPDVKTFLLAVVKDKEEVIDPKLLEWFHLHMFGPTESEDDEIPF